jgi:cysteine desulfurase
MTEAVPHRNHPDERAYFDAGGRAPLHPRGRAALDAALSEGWADPRRLHAEGRRARLLLDGARESLAAAVGARTEEVHFAPSLTQALHHAILGVTTGRRRVGGTVAVSAVERAAVLHSAALATSRHPEGCVEMIPVDHTGRVDLNTLNSVIARPGCALAALQHANGEVGTRQPVAEVLGAARAAGVPLLVDAGASLGHVAVGPDWDLLAADPADWGGPSGTAVLAVRGRVRWSRAWPEDDAEAGWFPGGVSVPLALAAAAALEAALAQRASEDARRRALVDVMRSRIAREVPDVVVVGDPEDRLPHVLTFSCLFVDGEALVTELDRLGFAVGSGSACTSSTLEPSHVLTAMGVLTHGNVRVVLPAGTTEVSVHRFCDVLPGAVARVRALLGVEGL